MRKQHSSTIGIILESTIALALIRRAWSIRMPFTPFSRSLQAHALHTLQQCVLCICISRYFVGCFHNIALHEVTYRMSHRIVNSSVWHIWLCWCILSYLGTYLHLNISHQMLLWLFLSFQKKGKQRSPEEWTNIILEYEILIWKENTFSNFPNKNADSCHTVNQAWRKLPTTQVFRMRPLSVWLIGL